MTLEEIVAKLHQLSEGAEADEQLLEDIFSQEELEILEENFDQLDELSKKTLGSYIKKAVDGKEKSLANTAQELGKVKAGQDEVDRFTNRHMKDKFNQGDKIKDSLNVGKKEENNLRSRAINRIKGINNATKRLTKESVEGNQEVQESEAGETLHPNSAPGDTKSEILAAFLKLTPYMSIQDLRSMYDNAMSVNNAAYSASNIADDSKKNQASIAMKEDLEVLFTGDELSEEFKTKAAVIVEAAVNAKVSEAIVSLEESYEQALNEELAEISEAVIAKLDAYLEHVADEFIKENEVAIVSSLKNELTEDFMIGLKGLFEQHYINLPEEKVDVVEELIAKVADLEETLDSAIQENYAMREILENAEKEAAIEEAAKGLTVTEAAKFKTLAENLEYTTDEEYASKLAVIKESHFKKAPVDSNILTEEFEGDETDKTVYVDPVIKRITESLSRVTLR